MAFTKSNDYLTGRKPVPTPADASLACVRFELALATGDLALNTIGAIGVLPAGYIPVDVYVDGSDMDSSTAALILDIGVLDAAGTAISTAAGDGGGKWGSTTAVNTAFYQRLTPTLNAMATVLPATADRQIAVKVATAPTTAVAGTLGVTLFYRAP